MTDTRSINTRRTAPVSTATLTVLLDAIADCRSSAADVADVVATDHGLASRVLTLANSAQYGLSRRVTELRLAVGLVGMGTVQTLAIANATALLDRDGAFADTARHAVEVATIAKALAPVAGASPTDAFAAGLLHDIGELLLLQARPSEYRQMHATWTTHTDQLRVEKGAFGTDHALLGAEHLLEWRVPDVLADAVADHHDPLPGSDPVTLVVAAADELVSDDPDRRCALDQLGIDPDGAEGLRGRTAEQAASLLGALVC